MSVQRLRSVAFSIVALAVAGLVAYAVAPARSTASGAAPVVPAAGPAAPPAEDSSPSHLLVSDRTVRISPAERQALGIETAAARSSGQPQLVRMSGTTALDPDALAHVHPRFGGETTAVKVRLGQRVKKGQTLAVVWSKDLGEKKSELIDARSQLKLNEDVLNKLEPLYRKGAISEHAYRQAFRDYESSRIAVDRAYHTLISWRLTKEEIDRIDQEDDADWPKVIVEAPIDGTIVEKNVVPGELVDPTINLFVIADLSRIGIWAYAYEEDLLKLRVGEPWTVRLRALPGKVFEGKIQVIGAVVDPTQHTVTVQGTLPNPGEMLRAGMYMTATVDLPPDRSQVIVPTTALIDAGERTLVYVQSPQHPDEFFRRQVRVKERLQSEAFLTGGVRPGERVVSRGALELNEQGQ